MASNHAFYVLCSYGALMAVIIVELILLRQRRSRAITKVMTQVTTQVPTQITTQVPTR